jgi:hypothetical protein
MGSAPHCFYSSRLLVISVSRADSDGGGHFDDASAGTFAPTPPISDSYLPQCQVQNSRAKQCTQGNLGKLEFSTVAAVYNSRKRNE